MTPEVPDELDSAPLAYENSEFLNSPDGRLLRIIAEYQEPMARFRRERIQDTVVFFGSARFRAPDVASSELELLEARISATEARIEELERRLTEDWTNMDVLTGHRAARDELTELLEKSEVLFSEAESR